MNLVRLLFLLPLTVTLSGGCSSTSSPTIVRCQDGDRRDCTGPDDCQGTKVCQAQEWSDCVCDAGSAGNGGTGGGSGNTGGSSSTSSTSSGNTDGGASSTGGTTATSSGGTGGGAGTGGSAGSGGESTTGSGGSGGDAGSGGSGGNGTGASGGTGGATACPVDEMRCGQAGRERCDGDGWVSSPCPLDTPACEQGECVLRGPSMVAVGSFYIDSTEVTVAQYREFLDYVGNDTSGQIEECSWNTSYWDDERIFNSDSWPINWVDWCDAAAFCDWAGKRLCGRIGGGPIDDADFFDQGESEWFLACGGPNGSSHVNGSWDCNTNGGGGYLEPVASFEGCEGWYEGLFDMEGNVFEWTNNCVGEDGATDVCRLAGGSYVDNGSYCTRVLAEYSRDTVANPFGFRCCND